MLIRDATPDDWDAIWPFLREIVAAGETYTLPRDITEDRARAVWMLTPPSATFVAVDDDGTVLGSAKAGPNQLGPGSHVGTGSFMVDPAIARRGVGRALGEHVIAWSAAQGFRAIQFNAVVETNTRALALWHSLGFATVGVVPGAFAHPEHGDVGLTVMHRPLDGPAAVQRRPPAGLPRTGR
ncbi:GNAT family N-acetyltransferase [Pseudonocardia abyssalis]|uniref:GNAT family N-acetyltransferase n=1 Tax=Pseudonocardia abyssalis TaxID=2792008 RepID=A0ABS6V117_9PSEU|nr:GNAT family N-acetyltransferase [Pseudonocardia abyssalis]MBW0119523.1 GNAT family N-acetyltransferase [Pseudonocardia abyssalis]MBW0138214.1 GNAT family N-acetyltransferase [Pseudonocardia abyssalis]